MASHPHNVVFRFVVPIFGYLTESPYKVQSGNLQIRNPFFGLPVEQHLLGKNPILAGFRLEHVVESGYEVVFLTGLLQ